MDQVFELIHGFQLNKSVARAPSDRNTNFSREFHSTLLLDGKIGAPIVNQIPILFRELKMK